MQHSRRRQSRVICVDRASVAAMPLFNPNDWEGSSNGIIQSCMAEYGVLNYCATQMRSICAASSLFCQEHVTRLKEQWHRSRFDSSELVFWAEVPELHVHIGAFFAGSKRLLDLLSQMLTSEKVVKVGLDGFHRAKEVYGGHVLNALRNNASNEKRQLASDLAKLILQAKTSWIDQAISARDQLVHPEKGFTQLMFRMEIVEADGDLVCATIHPPHIGKTPIVEYSNTVLKAAYDFASCFLRLLRPGGTGR